MKFWALIVMMVFNVTAASASIVEGGILQVGRYAMKWDEPRGVFHHLEIFPGKKFRYWDFGTQKDLFFYEGTVKNFKPVGPNRYKFDLIVERDGRLKGKQVVPVSTSEFDLKIRRVHCEVIISTFSTFIMVEREVSYRGESPFRIQTFGHNIVFDGDYDTSKFFGIPIQY